MTKKRLTSFRPGSRHLTSIDDHRTIFHEHKCWYASDTLASHAEHLFAVVVDGQLDVDIRFGRDELQRGQVIFGEYGRLVAHDHVAIVRHVVVSRFGYLERRNHFGSI